MTSTPASPSAAKHPPTPAADTENGPTQQCRMSSLRRTYAICSNIIAVLFILSAFESNLTIHAVLVRLSAAAFLTLTTHSLLLCYSPPEERMLSSVILCVISGAMSFYLPLLMLW
ncbi:hypothetical protein BJX61DRAFT_492992 [Aspergillus egyptiacus]|nr:hypothetical protein BJX61DRAFT_492992 [Aspergillus egyptiacus]